jgi:hypothetical protein
MLFLTGLLRGFATNGTNFHECNLWAENNLAKTQSRKVFFKVNCFATLRLCESFFLNFSFSNRFIDQI